jgi:hypothetical protein
MRKVALACAASVGIVGLPLYLACGGGTSGNPDQTDASDGPADALPDANRPEVVVPPPDASVLNCMLADRTDPVALCTQKLVLRSLHNAAFNTTTGVAASWSYATGLPDPVPHDWHDDVGYAAALTGYYQSSLLYGDTELTPTVSGDLMTLTTLVLAELAMLPDEYSGEAYQRLRAAAGGLRLLNFVTDGDMLDAIADAYGRAIYTKYFFALASPPPVDAGGGDAGAGDAGPDASADASADGATGDAGEGGAPIADGIIGRPMNGAYAYTTADVATAALALLDLAARNPGDVNHSAWQLAAQGAFEHLYNRARDATTGLYYRALITSTDPVHDQLDPAQTPNDALLADVTATVALALSRADELVTKNASSLPLVVSYPLNQHAADALDAVNATPSLYDGPVEAGATSTGFMEGYVPSSATLITSKATRANAYLMATQNRLELSPHSVNTKWGPEVGSLFHSLTDVLPENSSLLSVVPGGQNAYLRASSRGFTFLDADGGDAGPYADSYQSAAVVAFVEGMNELLYGRMP